MPKDDFMWYLTKDKGHNGIGRKTTARYIHDAFCDNKSEAQEMSYVVTVKNGRTTDTCMVFMTDVTALRSCQNFFDALIMTNMRTSREVQCELLEMSEHTMDRLAEVWYEWGREDDAGHVLEKNTVPSGRRWFRNTSRRPHLGQVRQVVAALCALLSLLRDSTLQELRTASD